MPTYNPPSSPRANEGYTPREPNTSNVQIRFISFQETAQPSGSTPQGAPKTSPQAPQYNDRIIDPQTAPAQLTRAIETAVGGWVRSPDGRSVPKDPLIRPVYKDIRYTWDDATGRYKPTERNLNYGIADAKPDWRGTGAELPPVADVRYTNAAGEKVPVTGIMSIYKLNDGLQREFVRYVGKDILAGFGTTPEFKAIKWEVSFDPQGKMSRTIIPGKIITDQAGLQKLTPYALADGAPALRLTEALVDKTWRSIEWKAIGGKQIGESAPFQFGDTWAKVRAKEGGTGFDTIHGFFGWHQLNGKAVEGFVEAGRSFVGLDGWTRQIEIKQIKDENTGKMKEMLEIRPTVKEHDAISRPSPKTTDGTMWYQNYNLPGFLDSAPSLQPRFMLMPNAIADDIERRLERIEGRI